MIKVYHTDNVIFVTSYFMEELFKNQQKIRFSGAGASHQNGAAEHTISMVFNMARTMLIHIVLIYPKETLYTDFVQYKWNIFYGSTVVYLIRSMFYKLLGKLEPFIFWIRGCRSLE